jgi:hypothetical protein
MKFIFKRYCLAHTYLSKYVKTSNEDKYHGGAKSYSGKWIPEWSHALVSDAMPYGVGQGGRSEQCCCRSESRADIPACHALGQKIPVRWHSRTEEQTREWPQTHHQYQEGQGSCKGGHKTASPERFQSKSRLGGSYRQTDQGRSLQEFFILDGARFGRIRKTPKGTPSPQEYAYKKELLQELERQWESGRIDLYYGDESHVCTEGYVPYAWKFKDEDFCVPVYKCGRLNVFGMIDRNCVYHGFTTEENINSERFIEFMDNFSLGITKETVVVLDNSTVHKSRKIKDCLQRWKERGLHIFYLPPYSPHLNIAETLWRVLKGKWIQPQHYGDKHGLFAVVKDILSSVGIQYTIKFCRPAA